MDGFNTDNILTDFEIENLFDDKEIQETSTEKKETEPVDTDNLFTDETDNSNEEEEKEDATSNEKSNSSSPNIYSSIAKALKEDSIFPDLNPDDINDADKFAEMFEQQVLARLDEKLKRFDEAINNGVDTSVAGQYEKTLQQLDNIKLEDLSNEDNETLRKNLIYMDLKNRGYSDEEAREELEDILESGTDIKKAERALKSNKTFYNNKYNEEISKAKELSQQEEKKRIEQVENLKKDILNNKEAFGDLEISKDYRQKAFDAIAKPIYTDPQTGNKITALQKYQQEHGNEFLKNLGLMFVLTDNFTNLNNLVKGKLNKESKRAIQELANTLSNTKRSSDGNLNFLSGSSDDTESIFKRYNLDI